MALFVIPEAACCRLVGYEKISLSPKVARAESRCRLA